DNRGWLQRDPLAPARPHSLRPPPTALPQTGIAWETRELAPRRRGTLDVAATGRADRRGRGACGDRRVPATAAVGCGVPRRVPQGTAGRAVARSSESPAPAGGPRV